ncbi:Glycine cleavage system transcriptional activator, partial [Haemophilus influenzae]
MSFVLHRRRLV